MVCCALPLALSLSVHALVMPSHTVPGPLMSPSVKPRLAAACMTDDPPQSYAEYMAKRTAAASSATEQGQTDATKVSLTPAVPATATKLDNDFMGKVTSLFKKEAPKEEAAADGEEKPNLMQKVKDAGVAGIISYMFWELAFWGISAPVCIVGYREVTGHWPDFGNSDDIAQLGAEAFAFVNLARFAVPLRIGLALGTVPWVQRSIIDRAGKPRPAPPGTGRSAPDIFFSEVLPAARRSKSQ